MTTNFTIQWETLNSKNQKATVNGVDYYAEKCKTPRGWTMWIIYTNKLNPIAENESLREAKKQFAAWVEAQAQPTEPAPVAPITSMTIAQYMALPENERPENPRFNGFQVVYISRVWGAKNVYHVEFNTFNMKAVDGDLTLDFIVDTPTEPAPVVDTPAPAVCEPAPTPAQRLGVENLLSSIAPDRLPTWLPELLTVMFGKSDLTQLSAREYSRLETTLWITKRAVNTPYTSHVEIELAGYLRNAVSNQEERAEIEANVLSGARYTATGGRTRKTKLMTRGERIVYEREVRRWINAQLAKSEVLPTCPNA